MDTKKCTLCKETKNILEFSTNLTRGKIYIRSACKKCSVLQCKKYSNKSRESFMLRKLLSAKQHAKKEEVREKNVLLL